MRPDLDDFEEMNQDPAAEPRSRAMSWLVLGVTVTGFAALAYYAYQSGTRSANDGNIMVVNAQPGEVKDAPANPGGEEFANKDKTIYDAISPNQNSEKVEKLLPDAEQPAAAPEPSVGTTGTPGPAANTTTYINRATADKEGDEDDDSAPPQKVTAAPAPAPTPAPVPASAPAAVKPLPVAAAPAPAKPAASPPAPVTPLPATAAKEEAPPPAAPAPAVKPKAAAPQPAAPAGSYKIQLGAFQSQEEAKANWSKISKAHPGILKGAPVILRADLSNGTFYRLRASGYASPDAAKAACAKLSAAGAACFYAGK